mgnify:CR=1 FL=1
MNYWKEWRVKMFDDIVVGGNKKRIKASKEMIIIDEYSLVEVPKFDYSEIDITENEKEKMVEISKKVIGGKEKARQGLVDYLQALDEANIILPKDGTFGRWCEAMNLSRDDVSIFYKKTI